MQQPCYFFLPNNKHLIAIFNDKNNDIDLIHPFDTQQKISLEGVFAEQLSNLLFATTKQTNLLSIIEKQYDWLQGLPQASLTPSSVQNLVIGDELGLLFLEITDQCNERCIHCYASSSPECHDFLSLAEIKSILSQSRALGRPFVQFTGGDPLIHRDLVAAVAHARALDFQDIEIYTNGLLLHDTLLDKLFPHNPMMAFSLYSADESTHDGITQVKGSWKRTVAAMHKAQDMALRIRIGMAIMEQNAGHEQAMLDFALQAFALDKTAIRFDPVHQTGRGKSLNTQHIVLKPSQNSHIPPSSEHVEADNQHHVVQTDQPSFNSPSTGRRGKLAVCANGNVAPCIFNREHVLGNVRKSTLLEMLLHAECAGNTKPSVARWNACQNNLSCSDCQMVAYTLGES